MGPVSGVDVLLGRYFGCVRVVQSGRLRYMALAAQEVMCETQGLTDKMTLLAELATSHMWCRRRYHVYSAGLRAGSTGVLVACSYHWWAPCWAQAGASPTAPRRALPVQVAGHPPGVRWEPGGLLLCTSSCDFKGHFGGRHRGSFCLLCPKRESVKAFSYSRAGFFLGATSCWLWAGRRMLPGVQL